MVRPAEGLDSSLFWNYLQKLVQHSTVLSKLYWLLKYCRSDPYAVGISAQGRYLDVLRVIPSHSGLEVLEFGCGEGQFTTLLSTKVSHIRAFDISYTAIRRARRRLRGMKNVEFATLDLARDALEENAYSLVVCMELL